MGNLSPINQNLYFPSFNINSEQKIFTRFNKYNNSLNLNQDIFQKSHSESCPKKPSLLASIMLGAGILALVLYLVTQRPDKIKNGINNFSNSANEKIKKCTCKKCNTDIVMPKKNYIDTEPVFDFSFARPLNKLENCSCPDCAGKVQGKFIKIMPRSNKNN